MNELIALLGRKASRGSKPRCHLLTHGDREVVARRLSSLIAPWGSVAPTDRWMPAGFEQRSEAQLHSAVDLLEKAICETLGAWWLPPGRMDALTPNWDISSTCTVQGQPGLLLIEAKAHKNELTKEAVGRKLESKNKGDQAARDASHVTIGVAIEQVRAGLAKATGLPCAISRDSHYQLSNRFAWSWKAASLGVPVILVYLGFLNATEMADQGEPLASGESWAATVQSHGEAVVPVAVWEQRWSVNDVPFIPIIRSIEVGLNGEGLG